METRTQITVRSVPMDAQHVRCHQQQSNATPVGRWEGCSTTTPTPIPLACRFVLRGSTGMDPPLSALLAHLLAPLARPPEVPASLVRQDP